MDQMLDLLRDIKRLLSCMDSKINDISIRMDKFDGGAYAGCTSDETFEDSLLKHILDRIDVSTGTTENCVHYIAKEIRERNQASTEAGQTVETEPTSGQPEVEQ